MSAGVRRHSRGRLVSGILVIGLLALGGAGCGRGDSGAGADAPASKSTGAEHASSDHKPGLMGASKTFAEVARGNESSARARVVGLKARRGERSETVTFTFADTKILPKYLVKYVDAIRSHPEDDPLALEGNAFLRVGFALTNPNTNGRLSVPADLPVDQAQVKEVLLARNVGGDMWFGIGLEHKTKFRVTELSKPTRLVVEVRTK
jgi:hypothetical protein